MRWLIGASCVLWVACTPGGGSDGDPESDGGADARPAGDAGSDGARPDGELPDGELPDGELPDGELPDGDPPDGALPDGELLDGDPPDGALPDGALPDGALPDGAPACPPPQQLCGGACVDVRSDDAHCGDCGAACDDGGRCVDGECAPPCAAGERLCGGVCVSPGDPSACGPQCARCPAPAGGEALCVDGVCEARCPDGALLCDGVCAACDGPVDGSACDGAACVCVPQCDGLECGPDPVCGAPCGACDDPDSACRDGRCVGACQQPEGGLLVVDVPTVSVTVDLTLDGEPLGPENTTPIDHGRVYLRDPDTGEVVFYFTPIDDAGGLLLPYTVRVVRGEYDVVYERVRYVNSPEGDNHWPVNDDRILLRRVPILEDGPLVVDVPTAAPPIDIALDGELPSPDNISVQDRGRVVLVDPDSGEDVFSFTGIGDDGEVNGFFAARVVAGRYQMRYERLDYVNDGESPGRWPVNDDRILGEIVIDDDMPRTLDVRTAAPPIDIALDGELPSPDNISVQDRGRVVLVDPDTGEDVFSFTGIGDDGEVNGFFAVRLVVGRYLMRYERLDYVNDGESPGRWPVNDDRILGEVVIEDDDPIVLDVRTAAPPIDIALDGELPSPDNISVQDRGRVVLVDPDTGEDVFSFTGIGDDGEVNGFFAVRLVVGRYLMRYERLDYVNDGESPGRWPVNDDRILGEVVIEDDDPIVLDVRTAAPPIDIAIDGDLPSPDNISVQDRGRVVLVDPDTGEDVFSFTGIGDGGEVNGFFAVRLVVGRYLMRYERLDYVNDGEDPGRWPVNDERILGEIVIEGDEPVVLDVRTALLRLDATIDGAALDPVNTNADESGDLVIVDPETGEVVFTYGLLADDGTFTTPYSARVVAGRYDVRYARERYRNVNGPGNHWPVNDERPLQCIALP